MTPPATSWPSFTAIDRDANCMHAPHCHYISLGFLEALALGCGACGGPPSAGLSPPAVGVESRAGTGLASAPFECPPGTQKVRRPPAYTLAAYALACQRPDGSWHGPWQEWFDNGRLAAQGQYEDGFEEGSWTLWYANGHEWMQGAYHRGKKQGPWKIYYESGRLYSEGKYENNQLEGRWDEWYANDRKKAEGSYQGGEKFGRWQTWHANGQLESQGEFRGHDVIGSMQVVVPRQIGEWSYYFPNGKKRMEGAFDDAGRAEGIWRSWHENGRLAREETYREGVKRGRFRVWDESGALQQAGTNVPAGPVAAPGTQPVEKSEHE